MNLNEILPVKKKGKYQLDMKLEGKKLVSFSIILGDSSTTINICPAKEKNNNRIVPIKNI